MDEGDTPLIGLVLMIGGLVTALVGEAGRRGRLCRQHWVGLRLPSTMRSDAAWAAAHRSAAGPLIVGGAWTLANGLILLLVRPEGISAGVVVANSIVVLLASVLVAGWLAAREARRAH